MSNVPEGPGWWQASDGKWYAPELHPDHVEPQPAVSSWGTTPPTAASGDEVFPAATDQVFPAATDQAFPAATDQVFPAATDQAFPAATDQVFPAATDQAFPAATDQVFTAATDQAFPAATDQVFPAATDQAFPAAPVAASNEYPTIQPQRLAGSASKSKIAAGLLGIFLGWLGIHRFYLGYKGLGLTMLLLSVLSFGLLFPLIAAWGFVEGVLILTGVWKHDAYHDALQ